MINQKPVSIDQVNVSHHIKNSTWIYIYDILLNKITLDTRCEVEGNLLIHNVNIMKLNIKAYIEGLLNDFL